MKTTSILLLTMVSVDIKMLAFRRSHNKSCSQHPNFKFKQIQNEKPVQSYYQPSNLKHNNTLS